MDRKCTMPTLIMIITMDIMTKDIFVIANQNNDGAVPDKKVKYTGNKILLQGNL
jgi:hypothetical protein